MGKGFEAFLAVIASHTAFTEAAEWHFAGSEVNDHIINTATAEATFRGDFFADGFVLGKNVKSQRMSHGIYLSDYFFYRIKSKDRHYRAENFFLHNSIFESYLIHDRRLNLHGFRTDAAAADNFCRINQILYSVKMLFVDNFSVIFVIQR